MPNAILGGDATTSLDHARPASIRNNAPDPRAAGYRGIEMDVLSVDKKPQHTHQQGQEKNQLPIQPCLSIAPIDDNHRICVASFLLLTVPVFSHVTLFSTRIIQKMDARAGYRTSLV
ncbi:MAG: hypothetical protein ACOH1Q_08020 [Thiobacillus sp.]